MAAFVPPHTLGPRRNWHGLWERSRSRHIRPQPAWPPAIRPQPEARGPLGHRVSLWRPFRAGTHRSGCSCHDLLRSGRVSRPPALDARPSETNDERSVDTRSRSMRNCRSRSWPGRHAGRTLPAGQTLPGRAPLSLPRPLSVVGGSTALAAKHRHRGAALFCPLLSER